MTSKPNNYEKNLLCYRLGYDFLGFRLFAQADMQETVAMIKKNLADSKEKIGLKF
jgi:hypothetical protein